MVQLSAARPYHGNFFIAADTQPCSQVYAVTSWYGWMIDGGKYALGAIFGAILYSADKWSRRIPAYVRRMDRRYEEEEQS